MSDRPQLPKKPYRGFNSYVSYLQQKCPRRTNCMIPRHPCWICEGEGKDWDPDGRDPIEGNKMNRKLTCTFCGGTGAVKKEILQAHYVTEIVTPWRLSLRRAKAERKAYDLAVRKLNADDKKALGLT